MNKDNERNLYKNQIVASKLEQITEHIQFQL